MRASVLVYYLEHNSPAELSEALVRVQYQHGLHHNVGGAALMQTKERKIVSNDENSCSDSECKIH